MLAETAKLERAYVGMVERGETNVSVRTALKLAKALDITLARVRELVREAILWAGDRAHD